MVDEPTPTLTQIHKDIAVLLKTTALVEQLLEAQNGRLREDHTMLTTHNARIESIEDHVVEMKEDAGELEQRVRKTELSNVRITALIGASGLTGGGIGVGVAIAVLKGVGYL